MMISEIAEFKPETLRATLPELPSEKRNRYAQSFGLKPEEVEVFVTVVQLGLYFEKVAQLLDNKAEAVKLSVNYILTDYVGFIKKDFGENIAQGINKISPERMADVIKLIQSGKLSSRGAKDLLKHLYETLVDAATPLRTTEEIAQIQGLIQNSNEDELKAVCTEIVAANPTVVADFKSGKVTALQFLVGQVMKTVKASGSSANPELLRKILTELLS
jgi:aspartyl-tRNA(Asn)/glutamyl-tRNA(Gln) amidotransferase subunit B